MQAFHAAVRLNQHVYLLGALSATHVVLELTHVKHVRRLGLAWLFRLHPRHWVLRQLVRLFRAKDFLANAHGPELHFVTSERASLVSENVVQLAQVFYNAHVLHIRPLVLLPAKHLVVPSDEPSYEKLDHLCRHEQRNRNQCVQQLQVPHESKETLNDGRVAELYVVMDLLIILKLSGLAVPDAAQNRNRECQDELSDEDLNSEEVHHALNGALLVATLL